MDIAVFGAKVLSSLQSLHFICTDPVEAERKGMLAEGTVAAATLDADIRKLTADCGPRIH